MTFSVGDRVKYVGKFSKTVGTTGTVRRINSANSLAVEMDWHRQSRRESGCWHLPPNRFELVVPTMEEDLYAALAPLFKVKA